MSQCKNRFSVDSEGIDMRTKNNEYILRICCKGCLSKLKKAIVKLEKKFAKKGDNE